MDQEYMVAVYVYVHNYLTIIISELTHLPSGYPKRNPLVGHHYRVYRTMTAYKRKDTANITTLQ